MAPVFAQQDLLTLEDLGALLKVSPRTLRTLRRDGLPLFPLVPGSQKLYAVWPDVAVWIRARERKGVKRQSATV